MNKIIGFGLMAFLGFGIYSMYDCAHSVSSSMNAEKQFVNQCVQQYISSNRPDQNDPGYNLLIATVDANCQFDYMKVRGQ